jgi:glycosyltransferase involved in cell wall biosynthesis
LLLDDPQLRERLGSAGRARVLDRFTWRVTAEGTADCYRALVAGAEGVAAVPEPC